MESFTYLYKVMNEEIMMTIKEFYLEEYPTDDLGLEIDPVGTFNGLSKVLDNYENVYEYIGVADSLIRERCFEKLSEIMNVRYNEVYNLWLKSAVNC
jgi:hypothetical protein